jgi:RAT1-interacting protein
MTKIMCTPYSNDDWELRVTRFRGIVYIEEHIRETPHHHDQDRNCYYGYKFEAICTSNGPVNTNVQFCSVFRTRLGSVRLLLGAEVDCLFQGQYAELKTNKIITSDRQHYNFIRFKLLKTWAQSFLAGVNHVIFGYRNDTGELQSIKTYATKEFPRMAREYNLWDPNVCLTFASKVLEFVQQNVSVDDANTVYTVAYSSKDKTISIHEPKHCDPFVK